MLTLREYILDYESRKKAIGHFNITTIDMLWAVFNAARTISHEVGESIPVVIGTSEGERDFFGERQFVEMIKSMREEYDYPVFSNADHTYSVARAKQAIDSGYDMVIIDAAAKSFDENVDMTKQVVLYRNEVNAETLVEAELGFIGAGSTIKDSLPEGVTEATMTDPEEADTFTRETGIDLLAPSVGNVHGIITSGNPHLDPDRVSMIRPQAGVPLVLHGGSGSTDQDFTAVINAGISMIHISTDLRKAYHDALVAEISTKPKETTPYNYLKVPREAVERVVEERIRLFYN